MEKNELNLKLLAPTLNNWTPITANINCRRHVTRTIFPIVLTATITHCTTCYKTVKILIFKKKNKNFVSGICIFVFVYLFFVYL